MPRIMAIWIIVGLLAVIALLLGCIYGQLVNHSAAQASNINLLLSQMAEGQRDRPIWPEALRSLRAIEQHTGRVAQPQYTWDERNDAD